LQFSRDSGLPEKNKGANERKEYNNVLHDGKGKSYRRQYMTMIFKDKFSAAGSTPPYSKAVKLNLAQARIPRLLDARQAFLSR
jgi:hypothetical protein